MTEDPGPEPRRHALPAAAVASIGLWRRNPLRTYIVLGALSIVWGAPAEFVTDRFELHPSGLVRFLVSLATAVWWAPIMAAQTCYALHLARTGEASWSVAREGLRRSVGFAVISILLLLPFAPADLFPTDAQGVVGWIVPLVLIAWLITGFVLLVRFAMSPVALADTGATALSALDASWTMTRGRIWGIIGLAAATVAPVAVLILLTPGRSMVAGMMLYDGTFYPVLFLVYVCLYLEMLKPRPAEEA